MNKMNKNINIIKQGTGRRISFKILFTLIFTLILFTLFLSMPVHAQEDNLTAQQGGQESEKLVVLMPTPSSYAGSYIEQFKDWYFNRTGKQIEVEYVQKGGVDCINHIESQEQKPHEDVIASVNFDVIDRLRTGEYLEPYKSPNAGSIPGTVLGTLVGKNPDGYYTGFSLSAVGIMVNTEVLENESLPMPKGYADLAYNKNYSEHIVMGSPVISSISHVNIDVILAHFGWASGWNTTIHLASNINEFTPETGDAVKLTAEGKYAATLAKYTYWYEYDKKGYPVEWVWPEEGTNIYVLYAAILKGAENKENAQYWIDWMLSEEGQLAWIECRYETPLRSDIKLPGRMPSVEELGSLAKVEPNYDENIASMRYDTVTGICLLLLGYHNNLKENYDKPDELKSYLDKWVINPKEKAEDAISGAEERIENASELSLTEKGQYFVDRAKMLLAESLDMYESIHDYDEAYRLAKESANAAEIAMAYPVPPPQPEPQSLWPYYLVIGITTLALLGIYLRRRQLESYSRELEAEVAERTKELAHANTRLQELDRLKSMFIASMSHELRTPLNSIIGFTGIMLQGMAGKITDEQRKQLTLVKKSANHLLELINDIIDLSKIEAGKVEPAIEEFDLSTLVQDVKNSFDVTVKQKELGMPLNIPEKLMIESDKRRIRQVLVNLIGNSVKFTNKGEIEITVAKKEDEVEISVGDTGIGIREEDMDKLFKSFSQVHSGSAPKPEGTGLGLYLSKKIVTLLGGSIQAKSEFGRGSKFIFKLPLKYIKYKNDKADKEAGK